MKPEKDCEGRGALSAHFSCLPFPCYCSYCLLSNGECLNVAAVPGQLSASCMRFQVLWLCWWCEGTGHLSYPGGRRGISYRKWSQVPPQEHRDTLQRPHRGPRYSSCMWEGSSGELWG